MDRCETWHLCSCARKKHSTVSARTVLIVGRRVTDRHGLAKATKHLIQQNKPRGMAIMIVSRRTDLCYHSLHPLSHSVHLPRREVDAMGRSPKVSSATGLWRHTRNTFSASGSRKHRKDRGMKDRSPSTGSFDSQFTGDQGSPSSTHLTPQGMLTCQSNFHAITLFIIVKIVKTSTTGSLGMVQRMSRRTRLVQQGTSKVSRVIY